MGTYAIGDIHGNLEALADLLSQIQAEVGADDVVVFLGDYVDRGPDSRGRLDAVLSFREACAGQVVFLLGNHEHWMRRTLADYARHSWLLGMGALETIRSYSPEAEATIRAALGAAGPKLYLEDGHRLPYEAFVDVLPASHRVSFAELVPYFEGRLRVRPRGCGPQERRPRAAEHGGSRRRGGVSATCRTRVSGWLTR